MAANIALIRRNTGAAALPSSDLVLVALAHGLILFIIVLLIYRISGAHANPAITISLATIGQFKWSDVPGYVIAQVFGAVLGALAIMIPYGRDIASVTGTYLGRPSLATNTNDLADGSPRGWARAFWSSPLWLSRSIGARQQAGQGWALAWR